MHLFRLLNYPLYKLYTMGPRWGHLGFWEGRPSSDICAELTNAPASFWEQHSDECERVIDKKVTSMGVLIAVTLYTYTVITGVAACVRGMVGLIGTSIHERVVSGSSPPRCGGRAETRHERAPSTNT